MAEEVWVEKYRPRTLDDVVGQDEIVNCLKSYVSARSMPHLLFSGPAGVGKTACAVALAHDLFGEDWRGNYIELNASDDRGIDVVRKDIKNFARVTPVGNAPFKIIFLDEADMLTADAQSALRRTMEMFSSTCRFIFSVNYSSKIIEPIQSRCAVYRFKPLSPEAIEKRIRFIASKEKLTLTREAIDAIVYVSEGDMRRAINALQSAATLSKKIDEDMIYRITATPKREEIESLIGDALRGEFMRAREKVSELLLSGLSGDDLLRHIHRVVIDLEIPDDKKLKIIDRIGEAEFRIVEGADEKLQLESLVAYLSLEASRGSSKR